MAILPTLLLAVFLFSACSQNDDGPQRHRTVDEFSELQKADYALSAQQIRRHLGHISMSDRDSTFVDRRVRHYYREGGALIWVNRMGMNPQADTLLQYLGDRLVAMGFSKEAFALPLMRDLWKRCRQLDFDAQHDINRVMAEMEYGLTKAYLRYAQGQRFGFVSPNAVLNRLDVRNRDTLGRPTDYRRLFDIDIEQPSPEYRLHLLAQVDSGRVGQCLRASEPTDTIYALLADRLPAATDKKARQRLLVNMERRRWRVRQSESGRKHVFVNVAAQQLWAVAPDSIFTMRVVCGARATKTPLLNSAINLIQVNPEWVIPMSIVSGETSRHAGDSAYFARRRYVVTRRGSGERVAVKGLSARDLSSGAYRITQEGGVGNSLGRIIFRFPNDFSVYLHDTSSPGAFSNASRALSHGCVRVQRPFDLARFMIGDDDEWLLDRLRISMDLLPETDQGREYLEQHPDEQGHHRMVNAIGVKPAVPVSLDYYTIFPDPATGQLDTWPDPYGYDSAIALALKPFL